MAKKIMKEHHMSSEHATDTSTDDYEKFHEALMQNDVQSIKKLLHCSEIKNDAALFHKILWSIDKRDADYHFGVTILRAVIEDWSKTQKNFAKSSNHERLFRSIIAMSDSWKSINACDCPAVRVAVTHWNQICLKIFAENGMNLSALKKNGENLLHLVCYNEKNPKNKLQLKNLIDLLIQNGCDINKVSNENWTPLHNAISHHLKWTVEVLIEHGVDVNVNNGSAWPYTPLILAVVSQSAALAKILIEAGANVNCLNRLGRTALYFASKIGDIEIVDMLIKHGAYVNFPENSPNKSTVLHAAASEGHLNVVRKLINVGAHVNARDEEGRTPLHSALELTGKSLVNSKKLANHLAVIDLLIKSKANVHVVDRKNNNLLHVAATTGCNQIVYKILQYKVKKFDMNQDNMTPLEVALRKRWSEKKTKTDNGDTFDYNFIVEMLIKPYNKHHVKSNVNMSQYFGYLLYLASEAGDAWCIQLLIDNGANINYKEPISGTTALHVAITKEQVNVISILISGKAKINVKDKTGKTPLHMATCCSLHHRIHMIPKLLKAGARMDLPDNEGVLPLDIVIKNDDVESLKFLLEVDGYVNIHTCYRILRMKSMRYFNDGKVLWMWELLIMLFTISPIEIAKEQCEAFMRNVNLNEYCRMYSSEITNLKKYFVGDTVSLYDFLNMNTRRRSRYIQNIDLQACARKFPRYHEFIKYKCHEVIERNLLMESANLALFKMANRYLPDICVDYILDFLRNIDLQALIQGMR